MAVTEVAAVATHTTVRLDLEDGPKEIIVKTLLMGPGQVLTSTMGTCEAGRARKDILHGFTLVRPRDIG